MLAALPLAVANASAPPQAARESSQSSLEAGSSRALHLPCRFDAKCFFPKDLSTQLKKSKEIVIRWPCAFSCGQNHQSISVKPQSLRLLPRRLCLLSRVHHRPSFFLSYLTAYSHLSSSKMKVPSEKGLPRALEFTLVH